MTNFNSHFAVNLLKEAKEATVHSTYCHKEPILAITGVLNSHLKRLHLQFPISPWKKLLAYPNKKDVVLFTSNEVSLGIIANKTYFSTKQVATCSLQHIKKESRFCNYLRQKEIFLYYIEKRVL